MSSRREGLERGILVGLVASGTIALVLLALAIPTNEFRARIWFLLAGTRDYTLHLSIFAAFALVGFAILGLLRSWSRASLLGVLAGAALQMAALSLGGYRWIPEFQTLSAGAAASSVVVALASIVLWRQRPQRTEPASLPRRTGETTLENVDGERLHTPPTVPWRRDHDRTA